MNESEIFLKVIDSLNKDNTFVAYLNTIPLWVAAIGAVYFGWRQTQINKRMQELTDYVAISIVPMGPGTNLIKVMNVGRMNLYLKQYVIGANTEIFQNPLLIPAGTGENSNLLITLRLLQPVMPMRFYLLDELGEKYISTGQIIVEQQTVPISPRSTLQESGTAAPQPIQSVVLPDFKIWTFKTEKYKWII